MKLTGRVLLILFKIQLCFSYRPEALDYLLRTIDYLIKVQSGVLSCVFWDISTEQSDDSILYAVLGSNRLDHVVKYVVKGSHLDALDKLPWAPSLLLILARDDVNHLEHEDTMLNLSSSLQTKDIATKVLVFVDLENPSLARSLAQQIFDVKFMYFVLFDSQTNRILQCNGVHDWFFSKAPHPMYLFTWDYRKMMGRKITFVKSENLLPSYWNRHWLNETARYLYTEAVEYKHNCHDLPVFECLDTFRENQTAYNIILTFFDLLHSFQRHFRILHTNIPLFIEIAVPRDRPLNVAELISMPFSWQVWTLLLVILAASELVKYFFPEQITNNPTLLALCGFERFNLHKAGRLEKATLLSLIILMFFMTNAFETKFVSLMVNRPSIQRIKTLEDLVNSDLKFYFNLERSPHYANHPLIGHMVVHGDEIYLQEIKPGVAMLWYSFMVKLRKDVAYDYDRMQPFYVTLDYRYFHSFESYWTDYRFLFLDTLRYIHSILSEAGLMDLWKQQWTDDMRAIYMGSKPREDNNQRVDLKFEDIQPAWMSLAIGLSASSVAFLAEHLKHWVDMWLKPYLRMLKINFSNMSLKSITSRKK